MGNGRVGRNRRPPSSGGILQVSRILAEARVVIEDFRIDYNIWQPHSRLGYRSPVHYAAQLTAFPTPVSLRLPSVGTALTTTDRSTPNKLPD